jgi:hypothetical protein
MRVAADKPDPTTGHRWSREGFARPAGRGPALRTPESIREGGISVAKKPSPKRKDEKEKGKKEKREV